MVMDTETIRLEPILMLSLLIQHNGLTKMETDMEIIKLVTMLMHSLLIQHNGQTKMETDMETMQMEILQIFVQIPLLDKLLMQQVVQILKSMMIAMEYQIQTTLVHQHLLVKLSTQTVVPIRN